MTTADDGLEGYVRWPRTRRRQPAAEAVWAPVRDRVQSEMTQGNFAIYFSRSRGLAVTADVDSGTVLTVGAPNTSAAEGLETQFARLIRRALDAQGHADLAVRVVLLPTMLDAQGAEVVDVDGVPAPNSTPCPQGAASPRVEFPRDVRLFAQ